MLAELRSDAGHVRLAAETLGVECPLLPVPLTVLVPRVGATWVEPDALLPHHRAWRKGERFRDPGNFACPLREPGLLGERAVLLWIDDTRYPSPDEWLAPSTHRFLNRVRLPLALATREGPGSFRQHDIRPFTGGMTPPPFPEVPALVTDWLRDANRGPLSDQHPMVFIADVHARFEQIHPFRDGNGRVGRLATNLLLVRHGYPPAVIHKRDRTRYLDALRRADRGDPEPLAEMFARAVTDGTHRFLLPGLAGPHRLVPLRSLADGELSGNALAVAAKRRRLRAVRRTDQWYSTRQWVEEYKQRRYQRS
jgi:hypothetical protein